MIRFEAYRLDRAQGLWRGEDEVRLTPKALSVLCVLIERAGEVTSKEELFRQAWTDATVSDSALTSIIQELRRALGDDAHDPQFIETLHRRGYRFRGQISRDVRPASGRVPLAPLASMDSPIVGRNTVIDDMLDTRSQNGAAGRCSS
jgi:DNA-binding winged helix-turn-helix (wHTH) protein